MFISDTIIAITSHLISTGKVPVYQHYSRGGTQAERTVELNSMSKLGIKQRNETVIDIESLI